MEPRVMITLFYIPRIKKLAWFEYQSSREKRSRVELISFRGENCYATQIKS